MDELEKENLQLKDDLSKVKETLNETITIVTEQPLNESVPSPANSAPKKDPNSSGSLNTPLNQIDPSPVHDNSDLVPATVFSVRKHSPPFSSVYIENGKDVKVKPKKKTAVMVRSVPQEKPLDSSRRIVPSQSVSQKKNNVRSEITEPRKLVAQSVPVFLPVQNGRSTLPRSKSQEQGLSHPSESKPKFDINSNVILAKSLKNNAERSNPQKKISRPQSFAGDRPTNRLDQLPVEKLPRRHTVSNRPAKDTETGCYSKTTYF